MSALKNRWVSNGLAMFSMFFGAGNVIFPLMVGYTVKGGVGFALLGLIITAVIVPFSGLIATTLFEGNYLSFFNRLGKVPGAFVTILVLALIGPFGGIPRCITLTYSTLSVYFTSLHLVWFTVIATGVIFLFCFKRNRILDLLGLVLTPVLIVFLLVIVIKGFISGDWNQPDVMDRYDSFIYGLQEGYFTMDLLAAFFFSSIICERLKEDRVDKVTHKSLIRHLLKASSVGALLLGLSYIGFATVASLYSDSLASVPSDHLLGAIGHVVLGPYAGFVVCIAVALSCLTTAIALTLVSSEFLQNSIFRGKLPYIWNLVVVLVLTALVSMLEFSGIVKLLAPILNVAYPSFLLLSVLNILYKLFKFKPVKTPVLILFVVTFIKVVFFTT
ncbi:MAG: branched-chain amino acid transport system II carrier protein [Rhabdochlamydiaceae bacterium]|nr:branched-chain amino acid transport system II carrier protein [Candidatus Amphrikana amoebophyrae]